VDVKPAGGAQAVMCDGCGGVQLGVSSVRAGVGGRGEQQQQAHHRPHAANGAPRHTHGAAYRKGMCIAREGKTGEVEYKTHNSPVRIGAGGLLLGRDDGLQVLLSSLLTRVLTVRRGGVGDLLGLFDRGLLDPV